MSFDLGDRWILKRKYQQTYNETKALYELYLGIKIRRIAHNITYNHAIDEKIWEIQDLINSIETLNLNHLLDKARIAKEYINNKPTNN